MLEDREYMRQPSDYGANRWRTATAILLIINVAVFLLENLAPRLIPSAYLGLSWAGLRQGYVWQLLTFQFLHANLLHLLLNAIGLFGIGFAVESALGKRRFWELYLVSGILGGGIQVLGQFLLPQLMSQGEVVGASAGLFGLIAAFALMAPDRDLRVLLFFVFPITVSAKVLAGVFLGISVLGIILEITGIGRSSVAHGAHAGGMLGGWLMLRFFARRAKHEVELETVEKAEPVKSETEFLNKEVDAILEKISKKGIQSLTAAERRTLEAARKKMS